MTSSPPRTIHVSAVVLRDETGRVLTVRKRGTSRFMLPGGKPEPGETPEATAVREVDEELGLTLPASELRRIGIFSAPAANEKGHTVEAVVFTHPARPAAATTAAAEIDELRWLDPRVQPPPSDLAPLLAPLLAHRILPALAEAED